MVTNATTLSERLEAVVQLTKFMREKDRHIPSPLVSPSGTAMVRDERWKREAVWLSILENSPEVRMRFQESLGALLSETNGVSLFADSGLPSDRGLLAEISDRMLGILLPAPKDYSELARLFVRMYPTGEEVEHFFSQPPEHFDRVVALAAPDERTEQWRPVVDSLLDAFCLLGARIQGLGLSEQLRVRSKPRPVQQSPFYLLTRTGDAFVVALRNREDLLSAERAWRATVKGCREELKTIVENMDKRGVNLDVVYALDVIEQSLKRMEAIAGVLVADPGHEKRLAAQKFLREVITGETGRSQPDGTAEQQFTVAIEKDCGVGRENGRALHCEQSGGILVDVESGARRRTLNSGNSGDQDVRDARWIPAICRGVSGGIQLCGEFCAVADTWIGTGDEATVHDRGSVGADRIAVPGE